MARAGGVGAQVALETCARYSVAFVAIMEKRAHAPGDLWQMESRGFRSSRNSIAEVNVARGWL